MERDSPAEITKNCKYCFEKINQKAKVCFRCGKHQNRFFNSIFSINALATFISFLLLVLAFFQYRDSSIEKKKALEASNISKLALQKVTENKNEVLGVRKDVLRTARIIVDIADILPGATGYGGGLTMSQKARIKQYSQFLNKMVEKLNIESEK